MIIQKDPAAEESVQQEQDQPPPPSYTEINYPDIQQPESVYSPGADSPAQYPPVPYNQPNSPPSGAPSSTPLSSQQRAEVGRQYREELFALCAAGNHEPTTTFGICGIICAIVLFPIGLICLCIDTESKCARCGKTL